MLNDLLREKSMTKYKLSKLSSIPYTTINDICSGKANLCKCSVDTVYKIAMAMGVTIEELIQPYYIERPAFDIFKSNICHKLKDKGDIPFLIDILKSNIIFKYYDSGWYPESLYLLSMVDYLSRENNVPLCVDYDKLRKCKLTKPIYPASVIAISEAEKNSKAKKEAEINAIPEFLSHNIIENEVRNVI